MGAGERTGALTRLLRAFPLIFLALAGSCAVHDAIVPASSQFATRAAVAAIEQYRSHVSPAMRRFVQCRFVPSCSAYGLSVVKRHGAYRGGWQALARIARCNPMTPMGTYDPPR